jgi:hypothetical protein
VAAAAQPATRRDVSDDDLLAAARLHVPFLIREPHDGARLTDVDVAGIGARRVEGDPEGTVETRREDRIELGLRGPVRGPQDADAARTALGEKDVPVWGRSDQARVVETRKELLDLEPGRGLRPCAVRTFDDAGVILRGRRGVGRRQVGDRDLPADSGSVRRPVPHRPSPGEDARGRRLTRSESDQRPRDDDTRDGS